MKRPLIIPDEIRSAIEQHVRERLFEAESRYWSAAEDEDTFTGQLGGLLGTSERKVFVNGRPWSWSITYTKFRGRGKDATETVLGADGIFEVRVNGSEIEGQKSVLFQSKMGNPSGTRAVEEALLMSNWREASVFLAYSSHGISVYPIDAVVRGQAAADRAVGQQFPDFFSGSFLACKVGDSDLQYDAKARTLHWRDDRGHKVAVRFPIPHRIRVSVQSPDPQRRRSRIISPDKIGEHRMDSSAEERLGLEGQFTVKQLTRAKNEVAMTFHPDVSQHLTDPLKRILNQRMAEFNLAFSELKTRKKRE